MTLARCPAKFRQQDVTRALRAARAAGLQVTGYEIDPVTGKIIVNTSGGGRPLSAPDSPLDRWLASHAHKTPRHQSRP
jgi:hypothetical protein